VARKTLGDCLRAKPGFALNLSLALVSQPSTDKVMTSTPTLLLIADLGLRLSKFSRARPDIQDRQKVIHISSFYFACIYEKFLFYCKFLQIYVDIKQIYYKINKA
jgi:hypothetical protein